MRETDKTDSDSDSQESQHRRKWSWNPKVAEYSAMATEGGQSSLGQCWKPASLKTASHLTSIAVCLVFIGVLEALLRISAKDGGLVFADSKTGEHPPYIIFCFEYLPTIIAVVHGLLLMCIDNDIKRLEPYYQLSKPEGADAKNSLLLDYPYQFAALVPWRSFRRRHWVVFCSGLIALLLAYAATPLMSAVLTPKTIFHDMGFAVQVNSMIPTQQQAQELSSQFAHLAYRYKYLNGPLPRYATETFALQPFFTTEINDTDIREGETWTLNTTLYEADLECVPAKTQYSGFGLGKGLTVSDGNNCSFFFEPLIMKDQGTLQDNIDYQGTPYTGLFMSRGNYAYADIRNGVQNQILGTLSLSDQNAQCYGQHKLLALWNRFPYQRNQDGLLIQQPETDTGAWVIPNNFSAVFCEPKYYETPVEATVRAEDGMVDTKLLRILGERSSAWVKINSTFLEDYVTFGSQVAAAASMNVSQDYGLDDKNPFGVPDMITQMRTRPAFHDLLYNGSSTTGQIAEVNTQLQNDQSMLGFAITEEQNLDDLLDPDKLAEDLRVAFKMYFAFALASELTTNTTYTVSPAERRFRTAVYVAEPLFSRLLQVTFSLIIILEVITIWLLHNRPLHLTSDPGSLAELIASVTVSPALLSDFRGSDFVPIERTEEKLKANQERYKLLAPEAGTGGHRIVKVVETELDNKPLPGVPPPEKTYMKSSRSSEPWELSRWTGFGVLLFFLGLMAVFSALYIVNKQQNGLIIPGGTAFVKNVAYSYAPTICGTFIEQYMEAMARFASVIMPYQEMYNGPATSDKSLTVHYESSPPCFHLFKAVKKRHFLLASLIMTTILANVLSVALGGLFLQFETVIIQAADFNELLTPTIRAANIRTLLNTDVYFNPNKTSSDLDILDPDPGLFYAALPNATGGITYPAWTTEKFHFLPFKLALDNDTDDAALQRHHLRKSETWGLGTNVSCRAADASEVKIEDISHLIAVSSQVYPQKQFSITVDADCRSVQNANRPPDTPVNVNISWSLGGAEEDFLQKWLDAGELYYEYQTALTDCAGSFVASWVPYTVAAGPTDKNNQTTLEITPNTSSAVNLICTAGFQAGRFSVTVNREDKVHSYTPLPADDDSVPFRVLTSLSPDSQPLFAPAANSSTPTPAEVLAFSFQSFLFPQSPIATQPRTDPRPQTWITQFMRQSNPALKLGMSHNLTATTTALERVYTQLFPMFLQTYRQSLFEPVPPGDTALDGHVLSHQTRMRVSLPMLLLTLSILGLFTFVVVATYTVRPGAFLRHVPTTLAATIPLVYASKVGEDLAWAQGPGGQNLDTYLSRGYRKYGYGWFRGRDGEMHLGVDREPVQRDQGKLL